MVGFYVTVSPEFSEAPIRTNGSNFVYLPFLNWNPNLKLCINLEHDLSDTFCDHGWTMYFELKFSQPSGRYNWQVLLLYIKQQDRAEDTTHGFVLRKARLSTWNDKQCKQKQTTWDCKCRKFNRYKRNHHSHSFYYETFDSYIDKEEKTKMSVWRSGLKWGQCLFPTDEKTVLPTSAPPVRNILLAGAANKKGEHWGCHFVINGHFHFC